MDSCGLLVYWRALKQVSSLWYFSLVCLLTLHTSHIYSLSLTHAQEKTTLKTGAFRYRTLTAIERGRLTKANLREYHYVVVDSFPVEFAVQGHPAPHRFTVPAGLLVDGVSAPWLIRGFIDDHDDPEEWIVHDYLYGAREPALSVGDKDRVFINRYMIRFGLWMGRSQAEAAHRTAVNHWAHHYGVSQATSWGATVFAVPARDDTRDGGRG